MGFNPAWPVGYVPTPAEWNNLFASKADQTGLDAVRPLNVMDPRFGAVGNGSTDDAAAWRSAIAALGGSGGVVYAPRPPNTYLLGSTIAIPANVTVCGDYPGTPIKTAAANYTLFSLAGSAANVRCFYIDNTNKTGGKDISMDVGANGPGSGWAHNAIENIRTIGSYGVVGDSGSGNGLYQDLTVRRCWADAARGTGYSFTRFFGSLVVEDCTVGYAGSASPNNTGFVLDSSLLSGVGGVGGAFLHRCFVAGTGTNGANTNQAGYSISNTAAVWVSHSMADSMDSRGFSFDGVQDLYMDNNVTSLCDDFGMYWTNCSNLILNANFLTGRNGISGATAGVPGMVFDTNTFEVSVTGGAVMYSTGSGVDVISGASRVCISGLRSSNNGGYGIAAAGAGSVLANGMLMHDNTTGNYTLAGGAQWLRDSMLHSGGVVSVGPGPVSA